MSNLHELRRLRAAVVVPHTAWLVAAVLPWAAIGCASRGPASPTPAPGATAEAGIPAGDAAKRDPRDTSSVDIGGGKTIERLFAGRFAGVTVQPSSDGGLRILIRGGTPGSSNAEPLYIVDGTPLPAGTGGVVYLNPYDISKIEVLKNPQDTGLYGLRGANGVIRITTLRPGPR